MGYGRHLAGLLGWLDFRARFAAAACRLSQTLMQQAWLIASLQGEEHIAVSTC
jgi:hypothetical protein